ADNHSMTPNMDTASFECPGICGDGVCNIPGQTCDGTANCTTSPPGGSLPPGESCRAPESACQCTFCGDGTVQTACSETCDPADQSTASGCRRATDSGGVACECTRCGDGFVQNGQAGQPQCGETCDPLNDT